MKKYLIIVTVLTILWGCASQKTATGPLIRLSPSEYPAFADDMNYRELAESIGQSLKYLRKIPKERKFSFGADEYDAAHMIQSLENFLVFMEKNPTQKETDRFIRSRYLVYKSAGRNKEGEVLFTGYYEPLLRGSLRETPVYRYPVYGPPKDMMTVDLSGFSSDLQGKKVIGRIEGNQFLPYHERKEIEESRVLRGKAPEMAWVTDPVDLFFLQIQGSGKIALDNGEAINVHYHSKNGRPYRSIGQVLIEEKKISKEEMSMQKIRQYLREHPEEQNRILNANPSYVFFSIEKEGPLGAINVRLTPGRSVATDLSLFPRAALTFLQTQKPRVAADGSGKIADWVPFSRFVLNQDTGGAIKGAGRADIFWGNGEYAEIAAGHLKHTGSMYFLVMKP